MPVTALTPPDRAGASLAPVVLGLRIGLHAMVTVLVGFVVVRAILMPTARTSWVVALGITLFASYVSGALLNRSGTSAATKHGWLALVTAEILGLVLLSVDGAFLAFPLFFLQLHLLKARFAIPVIAVTTTVTIIAVGVRGGWNVGVVLGPILGASVALVLGLAYRALYRETRVRQDLITELLATRAELALREREAGVSDERSRLAREIHDTVAQGLSSIQLLLHAAERAGASGTALEHIRLARETAAEGLQETRQFIRELSPAALEGQSLVSALSRLAASSTRDGLEVSVHVSGDPDRLPMPLETTLLRIGQATLANVAQHAGASRAELTLTYLDDWVGLDVVDNGVGFDPSETRQPASFGLTALRERVEKLGGTLSIESSPGAGTAIAVGFSVERDEP